MSKWVYQGEAFTIRSKGLTDAQKDSACAALLIARDRILNPGDPRFEVERMPDDFRAGDVPKRKRGRPSKASQDTARVSAPIDAEKAGETVIYTPAKVQDETVTHSIEETRYAQGFYRVPCAVCGEGIPLTGKRGRAPKYHATCRPVE